MEITNTTNNTAPKRLLSLDILRGFDLICLVLLQPIVYTWLDILKPAEGTFLYGVFHQILHTPWVGFNFWDIIMPLFMFMSGITIPFAMSKYKSGEKAVNTDFFRRILKRFIILVVVGWMIQGNLMALDIKQFHVFANTLQSIAVGYVVVALLFVFTSFRTQVAVVLISFLSYIAVFAIWGHMDFTIGTNICEEIDRVVLGHFRDGVIWKGDTWTFDPEYDYTWILSSLNFVVTVFLGCLAGYILKGKKDSEMRKFYKLMIYGVLLIVASLALHPLVPIIKKIWSSSMALFAGGICFLLMGLFYYCIDIKGWKKGIGWFKFYGMNSLAAYFLDKFLSFDSLTDSFFYGFKQWMGDFYPIVDSVIQGLIVLLILRWMYKNKIFIKA